MQIYAKKNKTQLFDSQNGASALCKRFGERMTLSQNGADIFHGRIIDIICELFLSLPRSTTFDQKMRTISLTYNERNEKARKALDFILTLGIFKADIDTPSTARRKTLKAIDDARKGRNITSCNSFEDYLKAVEE